MYICAICSKLKASKWVIIKFGLWVLKKKKKKKDLKSLWKVCELWREKVLGTLVNPDSRMNNTLWILFLLSVLFSFILVFFHCVADGYFIHLQHRFPTDKVCSTVPHKGDHHHLPNEHSQTCPSGLGWQPHCCHAHRWWIGDQVFCVIICGLHSMHSSSAMFDFVSGHELWACGGRQIITEELWWYRSQKMAIWFTYSFFSIPSVSRRHWRRSWRSRPIQDIKNSITLTKHRFPRPSYHSVLMERQMADGKCKGCMHSL